jgi:hypothetical protein
MILLVVFSTFKGHQTLQSLIQKDLRNKEEFPPMVVEEMLNSTEKPERITISLIGSKLGIRALLEKHLDKLPITNQYLDSVKESRRDFQLRRIK